MSIKEKDIKVNVADELNAIINNAKKIQFKTGFFSFATKKSNIRLQAIFELCQKNLLKNRDNPEKIVETMATFEKQMTTFINHSLNGFNKNSKLSGLSDKLATLAKLNKSLNDVNLCLANNAQMIIDTASNKNPKNKVWTQLKAIAQNIEIDHSMVDITILKDEEAKSNIESISRTSCSLALVCLMKEGFSTNGANFIKELSLSLSKDKPLKIMPIFTTISGGMAVSVSSTDAYATVSDKKSNKKQSFDKLGKLAKPSKGSGSVLTVPVVISVDDYDNLPKFLKKDGIVEQVLSQSMGGDLAFGKKTISFLPFQLEFFHELIHVLHNANGNNVRNLPIPEDKQSKWSTYEEYVTIKDGKYTEAQFAPSYGAMPREHHGAVPSEELFNASIRKSSETLSNMIENNSHTEKSHKDSKHEHFKQQMHDIKLDDSHDSTISISKK
jgi:hypothetical protein